MNLADRAMGYGLRALNRLAGSELMDRLHLRKPAEHLLYRTARSGFRSAAAASRAFVAARKLLQPERPPRAAPADLFDLTPSEEQQMLREAARSFADERLRAAAAAADAAGAAPEELLAAARELGLTALGVPETFGGTGGERSAMTNVLIAEALAHGDLSLALACLAPAAVSTALTLWGDADQQARYLPAFAGQKPPAAALALMEGPGLFDPFSLATRARENGAGYVLEGVKALVPVAASAELFVVGAMLDGQPALFVVESSSRGLNVAPEPAMGLRAAATGRLVLERVLLPRTARLGADRAEIYEECVQLARLGWCALACGTAQAVLDYVIPYVNERSAFGEPISHRQAVAFAVADIAIELEGMRLTTWRAASRAERGLPYAREAALARRLCADHAMAIGSQGVQLLGGHGYVKEHPVERWYRDLRAAGLMEGAVLI
jgi:alkylation response protein AidB-like acyl-CoA dehydrogenase